MIYDFLIAGAGVIGSMIARELSRYQVSICMLEKENDVACGATKANSGIVHGGYDPEPGTLKAKLNTQGVELLFEAARQLHVPCIRNGSLVCAFCAEDDQSIQKLYDRGQINQIPGLEILTGEQARALEPQLSPAVTSALHVTNAGIICPYELTIAAAGNAMDNGAQLLRQFQIIKIEKRNDLFVVTAADGRQVLGKTLINCAGTGSDQIARLAGDDCFTIIPRAGEYMLLDKTEGSRVKHTIFQVPTREGKGILVSPTVDGNLLVGPTAGVCQSTDTTPEGLQTVGKLSAKSVPTVNFRSVITSFAGIRSSEKDGDFIIRYSEKIKNLLHVAAIDSPGLTCCVSIARYVVELIGQLPVNPEFNGTRPDPHRFRHMSDEEKNRAIVNDPAYGKIVCRCETVSEGEIRDAILRNPPALDVDGVKRRTRSGMGRCQGGFCGPYVMELLAKLNNIPKEQITKNGGDSYMLTGKL